MTSLSRISLTIRHLQSWRTNREQKGLPTSYLKEAIHLLSEYRNTVKERHATQETHRGNRKSS